MSAPLRKGWCPGALRPMAAADGLVVRLRITGGILAATTAHAVADLAARHGNSHLDLTSRANLQMRGVTDASLPALVDDLRALGLVDTDAAAEAVRNVIAGPLAGLDGGLDIRPLVAALEARLAGTSALHALPQKFGFLVDDGGTLAGVAADVRFDWHADIGLFAIGLGGTRADAIPAGGCAAHDLVDRAEALARGALTGFARVPTARRMHSLVAVLGAGEVLRLCADARPGAAQPNPEPVCFSDRAKHTGPGSPLRSIRDDGVLELAAPYGRLDAGMLRVAADLSTAGLGELRLTPWRSLLLPGVVAADAQEGARQSGWITEDADPRLAIAACVGAPECQRATVRTREDADALAGHLAAPGGAHPALHVSGCAKGCAQAGPTPVVLVGRDGRYDLVRDGRAGDPPARRGLDLAAAQVAVAALLRG